MVKNRAISSNTVFISLLNNVTKKGHAILKVSFRHISGVELDSSQYVTPFNENGIRTQTKLNSAEAVATVSPFRTSRASNRTSSLTGPICDAETQRLRRELQQEQERVQRLSAQLSTNVSSSILLLLRHLV
jgi:hypothetical protein